MNTPLAPERFEDVEPLGHGGVGEVLRARDRLLGREVAIKRLLPGYTQDTEFLERFMAEARATGQLEHPNIPPIYEYGKDEEGNPFFALKLVRGQNMRAVIDKLRAGDELLLQQYSFHARLQVFQKVCQAVAYAHERQVYHCDIKPDNIMLGDFGEVFLLDWGMAQVADEPEAEAFSGTPLYAAPEALTSNRATPTAEVYSLGATLYEWLTLEPPYQAEHLNELLRKILTESPQHPFWRTHPVQDRVPIEMCNIVLHAMERDLKKRPQTVEQLLNEVQNVLQGDICPVCPTTTMKFGYRHLARFVDNYPVAVFFVLLWLLYPLYSLLRALWEWLH